MTGMREFEVVVGAGTRRAGGTDGVRVTAFGQFNTETWQSTGKGDAVDIDSTALTDEVGALLHAVDTVAEIPKSIGADAAVQRVCPDVAPRNVHVGSSSP